MKGYLSVVVLTGLFVLLGAQVPLETTPSWVSDISSSTRDIAFGDIDGDGNLDMVVGNEVAENATHIYFNTGTGLETYPSIILSDPGCWPVAFGDVDNDGDLDLTTGYTNFGGYHARLYLNQGGILDTVPDWISSLGALWLGWGDVDGDGDLDLAAVDLFSPASVYLNNNGTLESSPSWQATDGHMWDIAGNWFDVDDDGDLDLVVGFEYRIYMNLGGTLETVASWQADLPYYNSGAGFSTGDVDQDGLLDLAVGAGDVNTAPNYLHFNSPSGLETTPSWISGDNAGTWRVALGDVDSDGYLDLAAANGGQSDVVYLNTGGTLETNPSWTSSPAEYSVGIAWGDVDGDGVLNKIDTLVGDGVRKLFYLARFPAYKLDSVIVNGNTLPLSDYCYDLAAGWVSLKNAPGNGNQILLDYSYSIDLDLAVGSPAPSIYMNTNTAVKEQPKRIVLLDKVSIKISPNPFTSFTEILFTLPQSEEISICIYDISGRMVKQIYSGVKKSGLHMFFWSGKNHQGKKVGSGVYFAKLQSQNTNVSKPIILIK